MLSGDKKNTAEYVASLVGIDKDKVRITKFRYFTTSRAPLLFIVFFFTIFLHFKPVIFHTNRCSRDCFYGITRSKLYWKNKASVRQCFKSS